MIIIIILVSRFRSIPVKILMVATQKMGEFNLILCLVSHYVIRRKQMPVNSCDFPKLVLKSNSEILNLVRNDSTSLAI